MSLLGVTVCLGVTVETFVSILEGNLCNFFFVCFYFVKLMTHIVLEPPATIKIVKSYLLVLISFLCMNVMVGWLWLRWYSGWRIDFTAIPVYV